MDRVILKNYDPAERGAITAFRDGDCKNNAARLDAVDDPTEAARYTQSMIEDRGLGNN